MNRIDGLFANKNKEVLNIYFTAGHPRLTDTTRIIPALESCGVDMIEVGMPYSDPLADGLTIQQSSSTALANGMTLALLFEQIREVRKNSSLPLILMGYLNQIIQYGSKRFLKSAKDSGIDGMIIPDLPMQIYKEEFAGMFDDNDLKISFLVTPQTSDERVKMADELSSAFLYVVSRSSITGKTGTIESSQFDYFNRLNGLNLKSKKLIGFGIHDRQTYQLACRHAHGAIIGSAFIRALDRDGKLEENISKFIHTIR